MKYKLFDFFCDVALVKFHFNDTLWPGHGCHNLVKIPSQQNEKYYIIFCTFYKNLNLICITVDGGMMLENNKNDREKSRPLPRGKLNQEFPKSTRGRKRWLL